MTSLSDTSAEKFRPALWTPGDWNAFFGFGTNILVNMLVLTGLLRFVLKMPDSIVFGRILPAMGLMMFLSTMYYAWLAYKLALKTGRSDVCALPSGISVPHMFVVTFVIMLPISLKTNDPIKGWEAGLVWVFFQSFILMIGGFIAPYIRKITPRAALLGTLAGVSITFICDATGAGNVPDAADRSDLLCHHSGELVRRREISEGHSGRTDRDRGRHADRLGLDPVRLQSRRHEPREGHRRVRSFRLLGADTGIRPCVFGLRIPRHHPRHRDSVRHLRSGGSHGQRRERGSRRRPLSRPRRC